MSLGLLLAIINVTTLAVAVLFKQDISTVAAFTALQISTLALFLAVAALGDVRKLLDGIKKGIENEQGQ